MSDQPENKEPRTRMLYKEPEARALLGGMSRDMFFKLIRERELKAVHVGRSLYLTHTDLEEFKENLRSRENGTDDSDGIS